MAKYQKEFNFGSNLPKEEPNHYPDHLFFSAQVGNLTFFRGLSLSEKLSEIKPPLVFSIGIKEKFPSLKFGYYEKATKFEKIFHLKGSDHLAHSWGGLGRFLGSQ